MSDEIRRFIQAQSFEVMIEALIDYAELQAQLYHALGDSARWEYWVKSWVILSSASNQMKEGNAIVHWQEVWTEHLRNNALSAQD